MLSFLWYKKQYVCDIRDNMIDKRIQLFQQYKQDINIKSWTRRVYIQNSWEDRLFKQKRYVKNNFSKRIQQFFISIRKIILIGTI